MFYRLVQWTSVPLFALYFRLESEGAGRVPGSGPLIVAANHVSFLDPAVLGSACPRELHFLMNRNIWSSRSFNWFFRGMRAIPVAPDPRSAREALTVSLRLLRDGAAVAIFPEGGRMHPGDEGLAQDGIGLLARRSGATVLPVGIDGTGRAMPHGCALPAPERVTVRFGEPFTHADVTGGRTDSRSADVQFTGELMDRIGSLSRRAEAR